jgi:Holliday junction resolvase-like predicted endonuclease
VAENAYQARLIKKLYRLFPGCEILKNDSGYRQGLLDLTILFEDMWAALEVKAHAGAKEQPNQDYFVEKFNRMSFAAFIFPENKEEVLAALQEAFSSRRPARVS